MEIILIIGVSICSYFVGFWRGLPAGYNVAYQEKYGKIFNLEVDESTPGVIMFYDLLHNKFLFQKPTMQEGIDELGKTLPENTTIVISRV